jgi:hypothetical protein
MNALILAGAAWLTTFAAPPLSAPPLTTPDELKRERVPADVDLVVHLDLEGFKQTQVWKHVLATLEREELEEGLEDLQELKSRFGIDPLTDVRAVTLFKIEAEEEPTVVLFSTSTAVDEALKRFQKEGDYERVTASGVELHTWGALDSAGERVFAYLHTGAGAERVVVLSGNQDSAVHAARVLRGEDPSHARAGTALKLAPAPGSFLYVATNTIPHIEDTPASQVFGLAQGIQLDLGEAGGLLRAHMGITTASPKDATDISNVMNGLISLARLAGAELGEALEILTGIRLNTRGSEVLFDFEFEVERLLEIFQSLEELQGSDEPEEETHAKPQEREGGRRIK